MIGWLIMDQVVYLDNGERSPCSFKPIIMHRQTFTIFVIIPFFKPLHNSLEDVYGIRLIIKEVIIQTHSMEVLWIVIDNLKLLTIFSRVSVRLRFKRNHWQKTGPFVYIANEMTPFSPKDVTYSPIAIKWCLPLIKMVNNVFTNVNQERVCHIPSFTFLILLICKR
mgnify:CR=1 FL=1